MTSKKKPDYTKFMRRPAALSLSPPSDPDDFAPQPIAAGTAPGIKEEDIPWAEIIEEPETATEPKPSGIPPEPKPQKESTTRPVAQAPADRYDTSAHGSAWPGETGFPPFGPDIPALPILASAAGVVALLVIFS